MRALLLLWNERPDCAEDLIVRNVLGHASRTRTRDVVLRLFVPRFVHSTPRDLWRSMAIFERGQVARDVTLALHFHLTAEAEPLLADFARYIHADRPSGAPVTVDDVLTFLGRAPAERFASGRWSTSMATRVAQGVLAALRDFGHLRGDQRKFLVLPALPPQAFAWMAAHRRLLGVHDARLLGDVAWQRFGLSERAVERLLFESHAHGYLQYRAVGSVVRLEFGAEPLEELAHVLVEGRARTPGRGTTP
jgi:hypothetical protein